MFHHQNSVKLQPWLRLDVITVTKLQIRIQILVCITDQNWSLKYTRNIICYLEVFIPIFFWYKRSIWMLCDHKNFCYSWGGGGNVFNSQTENVYFADQNCLTLELRWDYTLIKLSIITISQINFKKIRMTCIIHNFRTIHFF